MKSRREYWKWEAAQKTGARILQRVAADSAGAILTISARIDPSAFSEFGVQWEALQLKLALLDWLSNVERLPQQHRAATRAAYRSLVSTRYEIPTLDPYLKFLLASGRLSYKDNGEFLTAVLQESLRMSAPTLEERRMDPRNKLAGIQGILDVQARLTPTRAAFDEAVDFYHTLQQGPLRPIAFEDLRAIAFARERLKSFVPHFIDSGGAHRVAPDLIATSALWNLMMKDRRLTYDLLDGIAAVVDSWNEPVREGEGPSWFRRRLIEFPFEIPEAVRNLLKVQDRTADFLGGVVAGGSPTIGLTQLRAGYLDGGTLPEYERWLTVKGANLWVRWGIDTTDWSLRKVNRYLLDPKWNIEAAATLYQQMIQKGIWLQTQGRLQSLPALNALATNGCFVTRYHPVHSWWGPDPLFGIMLNPDAFRSIEHIDYTEWHPWSYFVNAVLDTGSSWLPYLRIMVLESGLFDTTPVPTKVVGLRNEADVEALFGWAQHQDSYLRDAALRSLRDLATQPGFPHRQQVQNWLSRHAPRGGLEERSTAVARDVAVAAWRGVAPIVGLEASVHSAVLVFTQDPELAVLAVQQGMPMIYEADGPDTVGLEEFLDRLPGPKGPYAIGTQAAAEFRRAHPELRPVVVTDRRQFFALVGLEEDRLLAPVRQAIIATRDFLDLAA